tara:strand:- start:227 stop:454 length:228 start_codon:yes stop_codon:yes gene_type:complete
MDAIVLLAVFLPLGVLILMSRYLKVSEEEVQPEPTPEPQVDLSSHTVKELRALAKERGLKGVSQLKKADLIKRLQ